ncbi:MAG: bifunctional oligoribonuclease/PAP phosphatase NrnA [Leadbetterella sp.]|nr:bifunctional oligoribonuclease/PAP phosphatase NrnA [Leadbetterella sp.]
MLKYSYFTGRPEERTRFLGWLDNNPSIVITFHQNPDGDAYGSSLGLKFFLESRGLNRITLVSPTEPAEYLKWMPGAQEVKVWQEGVTETLISGADLIFCLDFSSASRLKDMKDAVLNAAAPKIIIDHHEQPEAFGELCYWNENASSTCELVFSLIADLEETHLISRESAVCLYAGLLTDTGSFRFDSTTPAVHRIAAVLLEKGVKPSAVHRSLFDNNPYEKLQFLGYVLSNKLTVLPEYRVAYMAVSAEELKRFNSRNGDTEGLVNQGLTIQNTVMSVLFTEKEDQVRISFRSIHDLSVADFAREHFDGGGHKNAAGGRSQLSLDETVKKFLTLLPGIKNELLRQPG